MSTEWTPSQKGGASIRELNESTEILGSNNNYSAPLVEFKKQMKPQASNYDGREIRSLPADPHLNTEEPAEFDAEPPVHDQLELGDAVVPEEKEESPSSPKEVDKTERQNHFLMKDLEVVGNAQVAQFENQPVPQTTSLQIPSSVSRKDHSGSRSPQDRTLLESASSNRFGAETFSTTVDPTSFDTGSSFELVSKFNKTVKKTGHRAEYVFNLPIHPQLYYINILNMQYPN